MEAEDVAHMHRLQRQDAKSRKTFKIKRNRSTIKGTNVARSATVKAGGFGVRHHSPLDGKGNEEIEPTSLPTVGDGDGDPFDLPEQTEEYEEPVESSSPRQRTPRKQTMELEMKALLNGGKQKETAMVASSSRGAEVGDDGPSEAVAVATTSSRFQSTPPSKAHPTMRFMQKSKSHDSDAAILDILAHAPSGTVRARIARHGVRHTQSRSPSTSPTRVPRERPWSGGVTEAELNRAVLRAAVLSLSDDDDDDNEDDTGDGEVEALLNTQEDQLLPPVSNATASLFIDFDDTALKDTRV
jgi:hypothetical protein